MSPSLLGSSASTTPGGSASPAGTSPQPPRPGNDRRDFDALLKSDPGTKDTQPKRTAKSAADASARADAGDKTTGAAPRRPGSDAPADSAEASTAAPDTGEKTASSEPADEADAAPWPPLGLAGLALAGLEPANAAALPAAEGTVAAKADPLLPTLPAATITAPGTSDQQPGAVAGALAAPAATAGGAAPIELPLDAANVDETALPKALTDAIATASGDVDAPTAPLLHALHAAAELKASPAAPPFAVEPTATPHVGGDDFDDALSARIGWLADQKIGHATIKVTPHDLGLIEVRLQMDGDKVHASFSSAHADVRHALESSIPRLRDMLNDQGFQLGNADVGHQQTAQDGKAGSGQAPHATADGDTALTETIISPAQLMRQRGLLDAYA